MATQNWPLHLLRWDILHWSTSKINKLMKKFDPEKAVVFALLFVWPVNSLNADCFEFAVSFSQNVTHMHVHVQKTDLKSTPQKGNFHVIWLWPFKKQKVGDRLNKSWIAIWQVTSANIPCWRGPAGSNCGRHTEVISLSTQNRCFWFKLVYRSKTSIDITRQSTAQTEKSFSMTYNLTWTYERRLIPHTRSLFSLLLDSDCFLQAYLLCSFLQRHKVPYVTVFHLEIQSPAFVSIFLHLQAVMQFVNILTVLDTEADFDYFEQLIICPFC